MAFTYDLNTDVGQIRLFIGDTQEDAGLLPDGRNIQDEEITALLAQEEGILRRGAAACLEMLSNVWAAQAGSYELGEESEENTQAKAYADQAKTLRTIYGYTVPEAARTGMAGVSIHVLPIGAA